MLHEYKKKLTGISKIFKNTQITPIILQKTNYQKTNSLVLNLF